MKAPRRVAAAATLATATLLSACDGSPVVPDEATGLYRLESVDGSHVPTVVNGGPFSLSTSVMRGEMLLLPDGAFEIAIASEFPVAIQGQAHGSHGQLSFEWTNPGDTTRHVTTGSAGGDSIVMDLTPVQVFRRFVRPPPELSDGLYVLALVNGHGAPFVVGSDTSGGNRYISSVAYDSITLRHGLFLTRSRRTETTVVTATDSSLGAYAERRSPGTFVSTGGWLVLRDYMLQQSQLTSDSLAVLTGGSDLRLAGPRGSILTYHRQ